MNVTNTKIKGFKRYQKTALIKAVRMNDEFVVDTLEGQFSGKAGDWLAEGVDGERYIIDDKIFRKTYTEAGI